VAVPAATRAFVLELFESLGGVSARAMMGGLAVYRDGQVFALVPADGRVYLKASGALAGAMQAEGAEQLTYARAGKPTRMAYWSLPEPALDDPEAACDWARRAIAAAGAS
jgi:DNA transformation protein and related proteins